MRKAIICDIDGTLAERGDRSPFDYSKVNLDKPKRDIIKLVNMMHTRDVDVLLFSGREDSCHDATVAWLKAHNVGYDHLFMRKTGDHRKDSIVKKEIYDAFVKDLYEIIFVLDDRDQVVEMWRKELGLTCLQVDYGDF